MNIGYTKKSDNHGHIDLYVNSFHIDESNGDGVIISTLYGKLKGNGLAEMASIVAGTVTEGALTLPCDKRTKITDAITGTITVSLGSQPSDGYTHRYEFDFVAGADLTLTFPESVLFTDTMTLTSGKRYRVVIDDNIATFISVTLPAEEDETE